MSKVLVLYYSSYGHIEKLAGAVAAGARETGATVDIKRVPETAPEAVAKAEHFKLNQKAPIAAIVGATTVAALDASRQPTKNELDGARFQGRHVVEIANKIFG